ncbi:hypothetical protein HOLleu_16473 [Holothuria leucospilota]|uniref:Uncharacterized protein n=1 Tax=Holothuria leucospilota TaxID=206669 RepID=A0A9Q1C446_HOLLE|nr:hypothetical protein HOLleu_16473 [Holothuria leucospilota]
MLMGLTTTMKIIFIMQITSLTLSGMSNAVRLGTIAGPSSIDQVRHPRRVSLIGRTQDVEETNYHRYANVDRNDKTRMQRADTKFWKHPQYPTGQTHSLPNKSIRHETDLSFYPRYQHGRIWKKRSRLEKRELGRSGSVSWAEWGSCNATCGVGYERREGRCNPRGCLKERSVEWRGCVGIKCPNRKSHVTTIVWCSVTLCVGFSGGVFITTLIWHRKWILEKLKKSKTRCSGETKLKSQQKKDANSLRSPPPIPHKDIEPSYIDVRELNTTKQKCADDFLDDWTNEDNDICRKDEDGYLIPDGGNLDGHHDYMQPESEPEYIDIVE